MVVAIWHPRRKEVVFYRLLAMPFGARNSVFSFAGVGLALQMVCCALFRLPSSEYVDDFTQVGLAADGKAGQWMTKVMHLLGWKVQEDPEKTQDFSTRFLALGVVFNCEGLGGGAFQV